jgi:hypothetical protein
MQLEQPQVSLWPTRDKVPATNQQATSGRKPVQSQQLLNRTSNAMSLVETACVPETS